MGGSQRGAIGKCQFDRADCGASFGVFNSEITMKLLNKEIKNSFAKIGCQEEVKDPIVVAKFFNPTGAGTWYATEYDPVEKIFFGYVSLFGDHNDEWGNFSLEELESFKGSFGLGIERDLHCGQKPISAFNTNAIKS